MSEVSLQTCNTQAGASAGSGPGDAGTGGAQTRGGIYPPHFPFEAVFRPCPKYSRANSSLRALSTPRQNPPGPGPRIPLAERENYMYDGSKRDLRLGCVPW